MAVPNTMEPLAWLRKHLEEDGSDLLREMIREFAEQLMAAKVDSIGLVVLRWIQCSAAKSKKASRVSVSSTILAAALGYLVA